MVALAAFGMACFLGDERGRNCGLLVDGEERVE
jgi:hypothetical protein